MNQILDLPTIEHFEFFNGQRLQANDLQALDEANRQLRWVHNRSLHTWGIAVGLNVTAEVGDREVKIGPGYALDNKGREILLLESKVEPLPPVAGDKDQPISYYLTIHYPANENLEATETRAGVCSPLSVRGTIRRAAQPIFCWIRLRADGVPDSNDHIRQIAEGQKIVLGRFEVKNCQLELALSLKPRRMARPSPTPYIACGATSPIGTKWELWEEPIGETPEPKTLLGVQVTVDTTSARFRTTPCYSARVVGKRYFTTAEAKEVFSRPNETPPFIFETPPFILEGSAFIYQQTETPQEPGKPQSPSAGQFLFRVLMTPSYVVGIGEKTITVNPENILEQDKFLAFLNVPGHWQVAWMGVEE